ncbi:hypothetical protein J4207_03415 [Candidatus Woesearchaeota archaeon]|nr:hypothetical protein [Candidatus Woesearchaeota archaeon]
MEKEQIDACVILELVMEQHTKKEQRRILELCQKYLFFRVATHCNATISLPALGEIWGALLRKVSDVHERQQRFNRIIEDLII